MSARRDIERRLDSLAEIRDVMNSMKTLAYMETRKLARFIAIQQRQVAAIEAMAADLMRHHPDVRPVFAPAGRGLILIGAERGFCGDFNGRVARAAREPGRSAASGAIIAVGRRLETRLEEGDTPALVLDGASAAEQVAGVLEVLAGSIARLQREHGPLALRAVYHGGAKGDLLERDLLPRFERAGAARQRYRSAPRMYLAPPVLFAALLDEYLYAALNAMLCTSLMAENQARMQHLDSAMRHLDERRDEFARRGRTLRQEEIVEEIEVILLNVAPIRQGSAGVGSSAPA